MVGDFNYFISASLIFTRTYIVWNHRPYGYYSERVSCSSFLFFVYSNITSCSYIFLLFVFSVFVLFLVLVVLVLLSLSIFSFLWESFYFMLAADSHFVSVGFVHVKTLWTPV